MTAFSINGNTYSDDGSSARDMRNGGFRRWMLALMADFMSVLSGILVTLGGGDAVVINYSTVTPSSGDTVSFSSGQSRVRIKPAADLATLTVELPPGPTDGQICEISTVGHAIATLTVTGAAAETVTGGTLGLAANGGISFMFCDPDNSWDRRF